MASTGQAPETYPRSRLLAYASLRMPLALLELPLYLLLPALYGDHFGLSLNLIAAILFGTRLADAIADPLIGAMIARRRDSVPYLRWIRYGLPAMALGFVTLLLPQPQVMSLSIWLALGSIITYLSFSLVSIAYQSWGADISRNDAEAARIAGIRESFGLVGVLLASSLLGVSTIPWLIGLFIALGIASAVAASRAPQQLHSKRAAQASPDRSALSLKALWNDLRFRRLLVVFLLNGIATAIPATLVLFFIKDVIQADGNSGRFLLAYFLAGALGMPLWIRAAKTFGLERTWQLGMILAVLAFAWTYTLGKADSTAFLIVCLVSGLTLGADLALPPALLAAAIKAAGRSQSAEASYFGVWNFATKFNLAAAAAVSLPLISLAGYQPGVASNTQGLSLAYAALPCVLKLAAALLLQFYPKPPPEPAK